MRANNAMPLFLAVLTVLVMSLPLYAEEDQDHKHHIDSWYERCVEEDSTTVGMEQCSDKAYEKWDKEMNKVYQGLMKKLPVKDREVLRESQRAWLKFRDAELKFGFVVYGGLHGTIWRVVYGGDRVDLVKQRTLKLTHYKDALEE